MYLPLRTALTVLILSTAALCPAAAAQPSEPLSVVVSVPPQADLVERIGGARVRVEIMIPAGVSPETYSPRPRQRVTLASAHAYLLVGHPDFAFEPRHITPYLERHPEIRAVSMADGLELDPTLDHHLWLSPPVAEDAARRLSATLAEIDPGSAEDYAERLAVYIAELRALDEELRGRLSRLENKRFLVQHPAWGWFAEHYGLEQLALEHEGKEASPRQVIPLIEQARAEGIRTVFIQAGFPVRNAQWIADAIGGEVVEIDPLAPDWFANLRHVTSQLEEALARD